MRNREGGGEGETHSTHLCSSLKFLKQKRVLFYGTVFFSFLCIHTYCWPNSWFDHMMKSKSWVNFGQRSGIQSYSVVAKDVEDVAKQNQGAGSQSVQVLSIRHLQGLSQEASATQHTESLQCSGHNVADITIHQECSELILMHESKTSLWLARGEYVYKTT